MLKERYSIMKEVLNRFKSPIVWFGIVSVIIATSGISPETLTSWNLLGDAIIQIFTNPFTFFSCGVAIYAFLNNPTTKDKF